MAALREQDYFDYAEIAVVKAPKQPLGKTPLKRESALSNILERMLVFLVVMTLVSLLVGSCTYILKRYVEIHRTQSEIFTLKQEIKRLDKTIDELLITKESEMTLEELEYYATEYLDMVKVSESYKVVVPQSYRVVSSDVINPGTYLAVASPEPINDPLVVLGQWFKRMTSF